MERDGNVIAADDDSVEIFLSPEPANKPYAHFMGNFGGSKRDHGCFTREAESDRFYDPDWTVRAGKAADGWTALVILPFAALGKTPAADRTWGLNLVRNRRGTSFLLQGDPVTGAHCPDYFARLRFD